MKKKLIPALLALVMVLGMLPLAAFATDGQPVVAGYGFVWEASSADKEGGLVEGATTSGDWMNETMYVYFSNAGSSTTNLWFQVKVGNDTWGCAATGKEGSNTYVFSFLNRGTQWEQHPTIQNETFDYSGKDVTHAESYMKDNASVTLSVYTSGSAIKGEQQGTLSGLGTAIFEKTFTLTKSADVKEPVTAENPDPEESDAPGESEAPEEPIPPAEGAIEGTVSDGTLSVTDDQVKNSVTDQAGSDEATEVNITVAAPSGQGSSVNTVEVPLSTGTLSALEEVTKPLAIDTPQGGVALPANKLVETTTTDAGVTFKMENTSSEGTVEAYDVVFYKNNQEVEVELPSKVITLTFKTNFTAGDKVDVLADGKLLQANVVVDSDKAVTVASSHLSSWERRKVAGVDGGYAAFDNTGDDTHLTSGYVVIENGATTYGEVKNGDNYLVQVETSNGTLLSIVKAGSEGLKIACNKVGKMSVWQIGAQDDITAITQASLQNKQVIYQENFATMAVYVVPTP